MKKYLPLILLLLAPQILGAGRAVGDLRTLSGVIYFTNNTPRDVETYPIELFTRDQKTLVTATTPDAQHNFKITGVEPGEYILKITRPEVCTLRYRVDLKTESKTRIRVIMDAACAHDNGAIRDLDEN